MTNDSLQFDISKIELIAGLGNVGKRYKLTRHNAGFMFVDILNNGNEFREENKFSGLISKSSFGEKNIFLLKPTTLMNRSGKSLAAISNYYNISPENCLIVHDDLDLELGNFKLQFAKGPKIHNGLISIEKSLGTENFWRLRIGVDNRNEMQRKNMEGNEYVLAKFSTDEVSKLNKIFRKIIDNNLIKSEVTKNIEDKDLAIFMSKEKD